MTTTRIANYADINKILKLRIKEAVEQESLSCEESYSLKLATLNYLNKNIENVAVTSVDDDIVSASVIAYSTNWPTKEDPSVRTAEIVFSYTMPDYPDLGYRQKQLAILKNKAYEYGFELKATA